MDSPEPPLPPSPSQETRVITATNAVLPAPLPSETARAEPVRSPDPAQDSAATPQGVNDARKAAADAVARALLSIAETGPVGAPNADATLLPGIYGQEDIFGLRDNANAIRSLWM